MFSFRRVGVYGIQSILLIQLVFAIQLICGEINVAKTNASQTANKQRNTTLPSPPICGKSAMEDRILDGLHAKIGEFPWIVRLGYLQRDGESTLFGCIGSLISQRYVLTAAICVTETTQRQLGELNKIRLGEFDIGADGDDSIVEMDVNSIIIHPKFNHRNRSRYHDIALIELKEDVNISFTVRPICLPSTLNLTGVEKNREPLIASGWGNSLSSSRIFGGNKNEKRKILIPFTDPDQCVQKYSQNKIDIIPSQLCAGTGSRKEDCVEEAGGPLMAEMGSFWAIVGVASFGSHCERDGLPDVYTRVSEYENWIRTVLDDGDFVAI